MVTPALALCIALSGGEPVRVQVDRFDLRWTHSVEKVEWREHWRLEPAGLVLAEARVKGSAAGMEPPEGARLEEGWWVYRPTLGVEAVVRLAASTFTEDHELCAAGDCRPLHVWLPRPPGDDRPVELGICAG